MLSRASKAVRVDVSFSPTKDVRIDWKSSDPVAGSTVKRTKHSGIEPITVIELGNFNKGALRERTERQYYWVLVHQNSLTPRQHTVDFWSMSWDAIHYENYLPPQIARALIAYEDFPQPLDITNKALGVQTRVRQTFLLKLHWKRPQLRRLPRAMLKRGGGKFNLLVRPEIERLPGTGLCIDSTRPTTARRSTARSYGQSHRTSHRPQSRAGRGPGGSDSPPVRAPTRGEQPESRPLKPIEKIHVENSQSQRCPDECPSRIASSIASVYQATRDGIDRESAGKASLQLSESEVYARLLSMRRELLCT